MRLPVRLAAPLLLAAAAALACDDAGPTALRESADRGGATAAPATRAPGADSTTPTNFPSSVRVRGRVLQASIVTPAAPGADSVSRAPLAGARVTLYRNVLVDGRGVSEKLGERTTGADGAFVFDGVPGGYFVLALDATAERPYGRSQAFVAGTSAEVAADLYVWR